MGLQELDDSRKVALWNAMGGFYTLCAAVSLPEGNVFRLEWPETALVYRVAHQRSDTMYNRTGLLSVR